MRSLLSLQRGLAGVGPETNPGAEDGDSLETHLVLLTMLGGVFVASSLETLQHRAHVSWIPESSLAVLAGLVLGVLIRVIVAADQIPNNLVFNGDVFFLVALPALIFDAGYSLRKKEFFGQLFTILTFSIVGTAVSAGVIGGILYAAGQAGASLKLDINEAMAFGSVLSATDAMATAAVLRGYGGVDPSLIALIMGEGALNDATSVVLYQTFAGFYVEGIKEDSSADTLSLFFTELFVSLLLGVAMAVAATLFFRSIHMGWWPQAHHLPFIFRSPKEFFSARMLELQADMEKTLLAKARGSRAEVRGGGGSEAVEHLPFARLYSSVKLSIEGFAAPGKVLGAPHAVAPLQAPVETSNSSSKAEEVGAPAALPGARESVATAACTAASAAAIKAAAGRTLVSSAAEPGGLSSQEDFEEAIRVAKQLSRIALPLKTRRLLEPKPESSVFAQTSFIILVVR